MQTWFDIEISSTSTNSSDTEDNEDNMAGLCNGDVPEQEIDVEIQELQDAILSVNQQPPPVLLVNVYNSQDT